MTPKKNYRIFQSVKIIHDIIHRIDYSYLAEFFRFIGVLVCEDILVERPLIGNDMTEIERNTRYNAHIYVGEKHLSEDEEVGLGISAARYESLIKELAEQTIFLYSVSIWPWTDYVKEKDEDIFSYKLIKSLPREHQKDLMHRVLSEVIGTACSNKEQGEDVTEQLQELINIYVENELWFHSMNLQYYRKCESDAVSNAKNAFLKSHEEVKKLLETKNNTDVIHWYKYAWLWCEMKVDTACDFGGEILYFSVDKLSKRCATLIKEYPWFINVKVLRGLCFEPAINRTNDALFAFSQAIHGLKAECFSASVYYWIGKRYEAYRNKREDAKLCYQMAEKRKSKFRTIFKLAVLARDEGDYDKTIELFDVIIDRLSLKMNLKYTDPLELEYLFKAHTQKSYVYNKIGEDEEAVESAQRAKKIVEEEIEDNRYFDVFYEDDADSYRELIKSRLNLEMVDWLIKNSSMKCFW